MIKLFNFDSIVTEVCICLANGPRTAEFQYGPHTTYSLYDIRDTNFSWKYLFLINRYQN